MVNVNYLNYKFSPKYIPISADLDPSDPSELICRIQINKLDPIWKFVMKNKKNSQNFGSWSLVRNFLKFLLMLFTPSVLRLLHVFEIKKIKSLLARF